MKHIYVVQNRDGDCMYLTYSTDIAEMVIREGKLVELVAMYGEPTDSEAQLFYDDYDNPVAARGFAEAEECKSAVDIALDHGAVRTSWIGVK